MKKFYLNFTLVNLIMEMVAMVMFNLLHPHQNNLEPEVRISYKIRQSTIWYAGLLGQMTHWPSIWCSKYYFFFMISCKILCKNGFNVFFHRFTKINWKKFCTEFSKKLWKKNNTWNIRCLVNESFVPATQQASILYWRLTDLQKMPSASLLKPSWK